MNLLKSLANRRRRPLRQNKIRVLHNRNIVLTGDFFPLDRASFELKLKRLKGEVQLEMSPETDILICGKFPDWNLIAKAKKTGIYTIYIDKVTDLFFIVNSDSENILFEQ